MFDDPLFLKIQNLSEKASIESGTSYEEYIRLFAFYFEHCFKKRSAEAVKIARAFGYVASKRQRVTAQGQNRRRK